MHNVHFGVARWSRVWLAVLCLAAVKICGQTNLPPGVNVRAWGKASATNLVPSLTNVISVAAEGYNNRTYSLALRADGTVVRWGVSGGQTDVVPALSNAVQIAFASDAWISTTPAGGAALRSDGTVVNWSGYGPAKALPGLWNVVAIAGAASTYQPNPNLALRADGTVVTWSESSLSPVTAPQGLTNVIAIASAGEWRSSAYYHCLALKDGGTVVAWGDNRFGQSTVPAGLSNVVAISAGATHSLALKADGTVVAWGDNRYGQTNVPAGLSDVVALSTQGPDALHSLAIKRDGSVVAWGDGSGLWAPNLTNMPPDLPFALAASAALSFSLVVVDTNSALSAPTILRSPMSQTATIGATAWLQASAAGLAPLSYQWYYASNAIPGATNGILTLTNLHPDQSGEYWFTVANGNGISTSQRAFLSVVPGMIVRQVPGLGLVGSVGTPYTIEMINDLSGTQSWQPLASGSITNQPQLYLDLSASGYPQRFYRSDTANLSIMLVPAVEFVGGLGSTNSYRLEYLEAGIWTPLTTFTVTSQPQYYFDLANAGKLPNYRLLQVH